MRRVNTTVVTLVGRDDAEAVDDLRRASNVRAIRSDPESSPLDRALAVWQEATRTSLPFFVHDADPLAAVREAWEHFFEQRDARGGLEVAVSETLARWRAGSLELPDYYLVLDAEEMPATRRHWFLGFLHDRAPVRVLPAPATPEGLRRTLANLRAGRWWPDLDRMLRDVDQVTPDQVDLEASAEDQPSIATV